MRTLAVDRTKRVCWLSGLTFTWLTLSQVALAAKPADVGRDRVIVKSRRAAVRSASGSIGEAIAGDVFEVNKTEANRHWIGRGWLECDDVVPIGEAIAEFTAEIERQPSWLSYSLRGRAWSHLGDPAKAMADAAFAIKLAPDAELAYYHRGRSWSQQGRPKQAIADFNQAVKRNPKFAAAHNSRANEYFRLGDYEKAIADYNDAAFLDPNPGVVYCNRAGAWLKCDEVEIAIDDYSEAIRRIPEYAPAFYGRGNAWALLGETQNAVADYRRAIELDPKCAEAYDNLAWLLTNGGAARKHRNGAEAITVNRVTVFDEAQPLP